MGDEMILEFIEEMLGEDCDCVMCSIVSDLEDIAGISQAIGELDSNRKMLEEERHEMIKRVMEKIENATEKP